MASAIEKELLEATGMKGPKAGEDRQSYFKRLIDTVHELPDAEWEKLNPKAQNWVNAGAKALNSDEPKDVPGFPDEEGEEEEVATKKTVKKKVASVKAEPKKTTTKAVKEAPKKAAKETAKESPKKTAKKTEAKAAPKKAKAEEDVSKKISRNLGEPDGVKASIKKMILKNPRISVEDLVSKLEQSGDKVSRVTVSAVRAETRHTIRVFNAAGVTQIDL